MKNITYTDKRPVFCNNVVIGHIAIDRYDRWVGINLENKIIECDYSRPKVYRSLCNSAVTMGRLRKIRNGVYRAVED
jgi:hypothetical protein